jgi:hypothetical protein
MLPNCGRAVQLSLSIWVLPHFGYSFFLRVTLATLMCIRREAMQGDPSLQAAHVQQTGRTHTALAPRSRLIAGQQKVRPDQRISYTCMQDTRCATDAGSVHGNEQATLQGIWPPNSFPSNNSKYESQGSTMTHDNNCIVLNWNVRGLNNPARRQVLRDLVADNACTVVCVQETKLQHVDSATVANTLGQQFADQFAALPAMGTSGGIILACPQDFYLINNAAVRQFTVTLDITRRADNVTWTLTGVYGP